MSLSSADVASPYEGPRPQPTASSTAQPNHPIMNRTENPPRSLPDSRASFSLLILLLAALTQIGCKESGASVIPLRQEAPAVEVSTVVAQEVESPQYLRLTGTLRGAMEADLAANVSGRVLSVEVDRGDRLQKGQIIARVDVNSARLALAEAAVSVENQKTQLKIDQQECDRYEKLKANGVVSEEQYDRVAARCKTAPLQLEAAEARKNIAAKNVGDGVIRAPFSGVVTDRKIEVGEYVQSSSAVVSLAQEDELRLVFSVPEREVSKVRVGSDVRFRVPAYEDLVFSGKVTLLSGAVRATRDMVAEASVENDKQRLLPGMFADVELAIGTEKLPAVPKSALFERNGKTNVFLSQNGRLVERVIHALPEVDRLVPVQAGFAAGDLVVSTPSPELKNGQRVK